MRELERIAVSIEKDLDAKDEAREVALRESRALIRLSKDIISAMNKKKGTKDLLVKIKKDAIKLRRRLERFPDILHSGFVESAQAEVVEVCILHAIINGSKLLTPKDLNVTPEAYLLGLGDVVGELRRGAVDALRELRLDLAERRLGQMENVYDVLMRFDYPNALVPLRKKQDVARNLVERTRGEILVAKGEMALKEKLDKVITYLEKGDGPAKRSRGRRKRGKGNK